MTAATGTAPASGAVRGGRVRGILLGIAAVLVLLVVAVVVVALTRTEERPVDYLSATSGSPDGARGVVEVLRDQGVEVHVVSTIADVRAAVDDPAATTIALFDTYLVLGPTQRSELLRAADRLVVLDPLDVELETFAPGVVVGADGAFFPEAIPAGCDLPAAVNARSVDVATNGLDVSEAQNPVTGCFELADDVYGVVQTRTAGTVVTLVGIAEAMTNGDVLRAGNAAFALNILGETETLVWYRPDLSELDASDAPSAYNRTAPWLTPLIVLALAAGVAAAVWRGRRFGPLVHERLPVVVRSNETMEGRARLYERGGARGHALDALRVGAVARLARSCNLPRRASVDEVIDAVVGVTRRDRAAVADLLVGREPRSDADLVRLSDELLRLETEVADATRGR